MNPAQGDSRERRTLKDERALTGKSPSSHMARMALLLHEESADNKERAIKERFMEKATIDYFKNLFLDILSEEEVLEGKLTPATAEGDEVDIVSVEKENQMDFRLRARNAIYLKKVRRALQKIEDGTFGECEECGTEISKNRLMARPTADLCIACKEAQEKEENQLVHRNRDSVRHGGRVLPIEHLEKGFNRDETSTSSYQVSHMDYQDIVG